MSFVIVDVEADGPVPAEYSMVCFGAVLFDDALAAGLHAHAVPDADFKNCCLRSGQFDGSPSNHFF